MTSAAMIPMGLIAMGRTLARGLVLTLALTLVTASLGAAFGLLPWLDLQASYGTPLPGAWVQLGATALVLSLCLTLPADRRMAALEQSHRSFAMGLEDVARAYAIAHEADRKGAFALSGEFDSVRARFRQLSRHPGLADLEPELLEMAAKMSHVARDLARTYSEAKVDRAERFLRQRQEEVHAVTERIATARRVCDDLRRWLADIEAEERQAATQLARLEADLREILPGLGYVLEETLPENVVPLGKPKAPK